MTLFKPPAWVTCERFVHQQKNRCVYFTCGQIGEHICKGEENLEDDEGAETDEEWVSLHILRSTALAPLTNSARKMHFTDYYDTLNV